MTQPDNYLLGRAEAEEARLKRQIANLAPDSDAQFDKIGIRPGEHVVDLGCGPGGVLHLLGKRVGPTGSVLGIERSPHFVELARRFVAGHALTQVEVREGDAYDTGLPRASFDGAHMRLVLVNVPEPERIVREMVSLVRPGGWVASFEAAFTATPAIRRCQLGPDYSRCIKPIRRLRGSTSSSVDARIDCFVMPGWWTSMSMPSSMSIHRAMIGDRSCETSSTMFATSWWMEASLDAKSSRRTWRPRTPPVQSRGAGDFAHFLSAQRPFAVVGWIATIANASRHAGDRAVTRD